MAQSRLNYRIFLTLMGLVALTSYVILTALRFPSPTPEYYRRPGFWPILCASMLLVLGLADIFGGLRRSESHHGGVASDGRHTRPQGDDVKSPARNTVLPLTLIVLGYVFVMPRLGYLISTFLFASMISMLLDSSRRGIVKAPLIALVISGLVFVAFAYGWKIPLPI